MNEIYKQRIDQSQTHHGDVRKSRNCDTVNYCTQTTYEGNRSSIFGSIFSTAKTRYDSQKPTVARWNSVYGEDCNVNVTTYRREVRTHENNDKIELISHGHERNYYENNSLGEIYRNNGFKCKHSSSASYGHSQKSTTNSDGLVAINISNRDQAVSNGYKPAPVNIASYYGNQSVALYDVQNTTGQYKTYFDQGVKWTSSRDVNYPDSSQRHHFSDTTWATRPSNYSNEILPYGTEGSSSYNLQHSGSVYRQHYEEENQTNGGHRTMLSYKQQNSLSKPTQINDLISRKRKLDGENPGSLSNQEINNNDVPTDTPKVDKRALYSKFRVVKRKEQSQTFCEISKVKPTLLRFKLGDQTIVDVNNEDGLPKHTKRAKVVSTVTPVKENEAEATIGNIEFITLDNMKVVRRKLEVIQLVRQEEERQERLKAEAEVKAKVKVNAKARMRSNKKHKDRRHSHV